MSRSRSPSLSASTASIGIVTAATSARTIISTSPTARRTELASSSERSPLPSSRAANWSATGAIADHGISSAIVAESPPRRASIMNDSVGSETETICAVSMCWSTVSSVSVSPATSVQISVSCASSRSRKCRPSAWSMSVMRRSLTPPSIDPPSSSSIAPSSSVLSVESSMRVPIGSTLKIAAVEFDGHRAVGVGPRQLRAGQDLDLRAGRAARPSGASPRCGRTRPACGAAGASARP